ncbi:MAG TPA: S1C family serine protease [Fimbriimonadales bacterium]|nr:S1C family serine protease [Fimbriimonadales bacterium]
MMYRLAVSISFILLSGTGGVSQVPSEEPIPVSFVVSLPQDGLIQPLSRELVERVSPSVVMLSQAGVALGQAVVISENGKAITTGEVAFGGDGSPRFMLEAKLTNGARVPCKVEAYDPVTDLALIQLENFPKSAISVAKVSFPSHPVVLVLLPRGPVRAEISNSSVIGVLSPSRRYAPLTEIRFEMPWQPIGASPVFDSQGNWVGILVASLISTEKTENKRVPRESVAREEKPSSVSAPVGAVKTLAPHGAMTAYSLSGIVLQRVVDGFLKEGFVRHPWIGAYFTNAPNGARITDLAPGSPAMRAGLRAGDIIIRANNKDIRSQFDFAGYLFHQPLGSMIRLVVIREGKEITLNVEVQNDPRTSRVQLRRILTPTS